MQGAHYLGLYLRSSLTWASEGGGAQALSLSPCPTPAPATASGLPSPPGGHSVSFILPASLADAWGISWSPELCPPLPRLPLSHSPWQPYLRPQEASQASEGPLSPSRAGQMEARLHSNNHGNRRGRGWGGAGILNWYQELRGSTPLNREGKLPCQGCKPSYSVSGSKVTPRGLRAHTHTYRACRVPGTVLRVCISSSGQQ